MPKRITLATHLSCAELEHRYRQADDAVERSQYQILWLLSKGNTTEQVAEVTGYSLRWIRVIANRYNHEGVSAVGDQRHHNPGAQPLLNEMQEAQLLQAIAEPVEQSGMWNGCKVSDWMSEVLDRKIHPQRGWEYLKQMEFRLRVPRPEHQKQDPVEQEAWEKKLSLE
jgi:transposase